VVVGVERDFEPILVLLTFHKIFAVSAEIGEVDAMAGEDTAEFGQSTWSIKGYCGYILVK
jgi:hypothetical protein